MTSCLYEGTLIHRRHQPRAHQFAYQLFMPFINLDDLDKALAGTPFWSSRRFAPARFRRADFLGDPEQPLKDEVQKTILEQTGNIHEGPIYLLANLRYFGFQMNPIACYYC